ncbi:MAG: DsbA family protein [Nitrospira sp.]
MTPVKTWFVRVGASFLLCLLVAGAAVAGSVPAVDSRMRGKVDAPVTMIEYSDFTCGYCLKFFKDTWPKIQARYVDTGKVRFLYKDYPRADQGPGLTAALAARCAGDQGTYWPMHDRLFSADGRLDADSYTQHAKAIGLDQSQFRQCLRDAPHVQSIFRDRDEANSWGFRGTPGFVLMRTTQQPTTKDPAIAIPGAFPFEAFEEEIEKLLSAPGGKPK